MDRSELLSWLKETDPRRLRNLWRRADDVRREHVGDAVHLRGLVEASNFCRRACAYCGLRSPHRALPRYRMSRTETSACARRIESRGCGTIVIQAGEDPEINEDWLGALIREIKAETKLAITLSLGERSECELEAWRDAGADRYLLRFETSNRALFDRIHPPLSGEISDRLGLLETLRSLGYETGSGVMVGLPGQSYEDLAEDIELFQRLDLDMIGVGPYIPNPMTPMGRGDGPAAKSPNHQAPNDGLTTFKVIALARLACPDANIPSTTALSALLPDAGHELALLRGANVIMPNFTPEQYRRHYAIYPGNTICCVDSFENVTKIKRRIESLGRTVGVGRGDSPDRRSRRTDRSPIGGLHENVV